MTAPTGGTWFVERVPANPQWRGDGTEILSEYGRIADTFCSGLRNIDECRANARLIAAAPELLALAIQYASECGECDGTGCDAVGHIGACEECAPIRQVIEKATGETT